jgi:hypothetical protein
MKKAILIIGILLSVASSQAQMTVETIVKKPLITGGEKPLYQP